MASGVSFNSLFCFNSCVLSLIKRELNLLADVFPCLLSSSSIYSISCLGTIGFANCYNSIGFLDYFFGYKFVAGRTTVMFLAYLRRVSFVGVWLPVTIEVLLLAFSRTVGKITVLLEGIMPFSSSSRRCAVFTRVSFS